MNDHHNIKNRRVLRQVFVFAASLLFAGLLLGHYVNEAYAFYLPLIVAAGLMFAGVVGICPMAYLIERMPWNKNK